MDAKYQELADVLRETQKLLARKGNDFIWSWWSDAPEACREIDGFISSLEAGNPPERMKIEILFAPTGSIQEVSMSGGWSKAFIKLADRFDEAVEKAYKAHSLPPSAAPKKPPRLGPA